jgi:hypothetical protein
MVRGAWFEGFTSGVPSLWYRHGVCPCSSICIGNISAAAVDIAAAAAAVDLLLLLLLLLQA